MKDLTRKSLRAFVLMVLALMIAVNSWAVTYSGNIFGNGGGLFASEQWNSTSSILSWRVSDTVNPGFWTYIYDFTVPEKNISHVITEVSANFTPENIKNGTTPGYAGPQVFPSNQNDNSNPGIPDPIFGLKWGADSTSFSWTIVTDRAPMWGDFYSKDGNSGGPGGGNPVFAYNTGFGQDTIAPIDDGNAWSDGLAWVLVPDTVSIVPEPGTVLLLGSGFLGLALFGRSRFRREA